ncbi:MAG: galactose mutarotase [Tannerellaceae bacterium]|nr:galactose mutarotase [Tannerellaceae bacterium]
MSKRPTENEKNLSGLDRKKFQKTISGKQTDLFILKTKNDSELAVTNYGCAILAIMVPDKNGQFANVVLGHDSIDSVVNSPEPFLNTVIGRYGNRICEGKFTLNNKEYNLSVNNGPNALHGGPTGYHTQVWDVVEQTEDSITFSYISPDGEEGFPGTLRIEMTYRLIPAKDTTFFHIQYVAKTDKATPVNLTNHAFFNLAGIDNPSPSIENHTLTIAADHYIPIDNNSIPTGEILSVEGTPMDFRKPHRIGERINDNFQQLIHGAGYDHCYVLNKTEAGNLELAAVCAEEHSGRIMEVYTTEQGVQLYTGNWLSGFAGANGATFPARSGVCFEAQKFPDTPNRPYFPTAILKPKEEYRQTTIYMFHVEGTKIDTRFKRDKKYTFRAKNK